MTCGEGSGITGLHDFEAHGFAPSSRRLTTVARSATFCASFLVSLFPRPTRCPRGRLSAQARGLFSGLGHRCPPNREGFALRCWRDSRTIVASAGDSHYTRPFKSVTACDAQIVYEL